jgi:exo-beta-1,3-glucanase (GH17 family)/cellulose synthase/poly-beta-1,6-N-acetylglucosamine synthase-like glycosyltransferase
VKRDKNKIMINLILGLILAITTFVFWAIPNRPLTEPAWPSSIAGMSFSPLRIGNDPANDLYPSVEEIDQDIALLTGQVHSIRTYGVSGTLSEIPMLAKKYGMNVTLGAWLTGDPIQNDVELTKLISIANSHKDVVKRVIVGNETILRKELTVNELVEYLKRVRSEVNIPVSTGEPWHIWSENPELVEHVDFIAAHFLPYWEGISLNEAVGHVEMTYNLLQTSFPSTPILMAEVGWPSNGRTRRSAIASEANEAIFLRRFLERAAAENYEYYLMEAFDQTWKKENEGSVGAYWGVFDAYRNPKFEFTEPIVKVPQWRWLAGGSIIVALLVFFILLFDSHTLMSRGKGFLAIIAYGCSVSMVWAGYDYTNQYLTPGIIIIGIVLAMGFIGISLVLLAEAHEWAETSWVKRRRRLFNPVDCTPSYNPLRYPKVSIHVPAYNEPPEMVKQTLNSLAQIDYPDYEVLVIDNNTQDPAIWQPVCDHCSKIGNRFRFFHVDPLEGYKAGALNFALTKTSEDVEIIAVIDSDYMVKSSWLKDLIPYFAKSEIGFVQAPQDYRDGNEKAFKSMCNAEYKGFFHIGMVTRNDRNAIIEHGTMTMIRASVLKEVGGWAEWCITEDAELGLRIFEHGYEAVYVKESYGKGLIPDTLLDYKKQRYRWAYGAIQILKQHGKVLFGKKPSRLTIGQRYHFLAGWLPWISDGINIFYTLGAIVWSLLMIINPGHVDPPLAIFMIPPVALFCFKVAKMTHLYRSRIGTTRLQTLAAAFSGLALSHTIAKAVVSGFFTSNKPFFRTPKCKNCPALIKAIATSIEETCIAFTLWGVAIGVILVQGKDTPGSVLWAYVLIIQSLPYFASLVMSIINVLPARRRKTFEVPSTLPAHLSFFVKENR